MSVIFLTEQGSRLTRQGRAFVLKKDGETVFMFPAANVKQVVIFGRIEITTPMIHLLLQEGIETTFLTRDGRFRGRLVGDTSKNIILREQQYARANDNSFCLNFARQIIWAKAKNTIRVLQKKGGVPLQEFARRVTNYRKTMDQIQNLDQLRGLEGSFSAMYFKLFPQLLINSFGFRKRIRHPPPDPVNILLSFGYTLLFQNLYSLILAVGLDPYKGFFHQTRYGHPALVSDLIEQFRAAIIDALVISLINRKQITGQDFLQEEDGLKLSKEAIEMFVTAYREKLNATISYKRLTLSYLQLMESQVIALVKSIQSGNTYQPFIYP